MTGADFVGGFEKGLQEFGQKVYNLYDNTMFVTIAKGVTQADVDVAEEAALSVVGSGEKFRRMNLLNDAHQQFDANIDLQIKQQNDVARKAVNELFNNNTPENGTIKSAVTQALISSVLSLVNQLTASSQKTGM
ncbi:toxin Cry1Ac domain D-VI-related protein [Paenilisteria rocourtiae]|uniref:Pesticidal crystal protein Cry1Aa domain-containing protein n=1 Tax=Listeria rocourtiae TaxID=647910 RepID=A0A4R6ZGG6_9LIST|nr:toxin Cry1Ac domain D-VI-related protein [Listeria rocourtiae]EUJ44822.1 hypothetical protein PROCOU_13328 [Listeria rocourtiae FSL F6-920]MBC1605533.1 hypothetical protein [Listeria rocourtiae]TDR51215.1 hypothetical protein DFP96_11446 [Listeria rocourtiae]